jgi:hypothetical protein
MANAIIIKGSSYSVNAIGNYELYERGTTPPAPINDVTFGLTTDANILASYGVQSVTEPLAIVTAKNTLPVGTTIVASDPTFYNTYKFAVSLISFGYIGPAFNQDVNQWDCTYSNQTWNTSDITLKNKGYYLYVRRIDEATLTSSDVLALQNNLIVTIPDTDVNDVSYVLNTATDFLWSYKKSSETGGVRGINYRLYDIPVGATIKAKSGSSVFTDYKFAISKSAMSANSSGGTWDTSYSGSAYIQQDITVTTKGYYLFIARVDGTTLTSSDMTALNENLIVRTNYE